MQMVGVLQLMQFPFYLNQQKMQSVHEFMQEAQMESARERLGIEPMHFIPKVQVDQVVIEDNPDFQERRSSYHELPKFASTKIRSQSSGTRNYVEISRQIFENIFQNINQSLTIFPLKPKNGSMTSLLIFIIWIAYALGTSQSNLEMNLINLIDFMGMGLAFALTFYAIIICKQSIQFDHFLHILGIIITIVLAAYSATSGDSFPVVLRIIRSFRLFFILNINFAFEDLVQIYFRKIYRISKVLLPWIFVTLLYALMMSLSTYYQYFNRCSLVTEDSIHPIFSDSELCGVKACGTGLICTNPMSAEEIPDKTLYNNGSQLSFGLFQYDNLLHSYFTTISSAFLTNTARIITIFMNSSPILLISIVNVLLILSSLFFGSSILLVLIQQNFYEKLVRESMAKDGGVSRVRVSNISGNSFAAPTFGPNSSNSIELKIKRDTKEKPISMKNQSDLVDQSNLEPSKSVKFIHEKQQKSNKQTISQEEESCYNQFIQIATVIFLITVGSAHFGLALAFVVGNLEDLQNRLVGVCLMVVFIVWTVWILLKMSGITDEEDDEKKNQDLEESYQTIFSIQITLYLIHLLDYVARIIVGKYIVEEISPLTPLAAALLLVRIVYLPIAFENIIFTSERWKNFNKNIRIYKQLATNMFPFFMFSLIFSMVLASWSTYVNRVNFFYSTWNYARTLLNMNWVEHYVYSVNDVSEWGVPIKLALILIGELYILNMIFADTIINAFSSFISNSKELTSIKQSFQIKDEQAIKNVIRIQKTFYLIPYDFLCVRSTIDAFLETQNYKSGSHKVLTIYMIALPIGYCILRDFMGYQYLMIIGDIILLSDACLKIIARRFWGEGSLVNNKWYNLVNFLVSVIILANLIAPSFDPFFLRVFRIFLLIEIWPQLASAYNKIIECMTVMKRIFTLIMIIWVILALMASIMNANNSNCNIFSVIISSSSISLRMMEKGFDLPSAFTFKNGDEAQFYSIYNIIIYFFFKIPLECILIGIGIAHFQNLQFERQEQQMIQLVVQTQPNIGLTVEQSYELSEIKKKILSYAPEFNPIHTMPHNFFKTLFDQNENLFRTFSTTFIVVDAFLLLLIPLITQYVAPQQLLQVKLLRFCFYFLGLLLFALQSIIYKGWKDHFYLRFAIYLFSFPGSLLVMVPIHKVEASAELANLLYFFLMLTPLPFIQLYYIANARIQKIISFIISRFNKTFWISIWILAATAFFAGVLHLVVNQQFLYLFSLVFIGMCGSSYQAALENNQNSSAIALYLVQIFIFYLGLLLRSIFIASFIFEVSERIHDYQRYRKQSQEIIRADFKKIFNEQKFLKIWNKLDVKAIGMLPFRTVVNHLFKFAKCFSLHQIYIEFILKPKHETYELKLELFRRLHLPIRVVTTTQRADDSKTSEYMVSLHDLIARFYCLALDDNIHKMQLVKGVEEVKQLSHTYHNWSTKLGFDSDQWYKSISERLNSLNYKRWVQEESNEKYFIPKEAQVESWSMKSIMRILPAIRTKVSSLKMKSK